MVIVAAAAAMTPAPAPAQAEDWPVFLGPRQDNTSSETGLALNWPAEGPPVVWRKKLGLSYSPPVVARGKLVAFHRIADQEVVEALDAQTGRSLWVFRYPTAFVDRYGYNGGPRSAPAIDGNCVYTYGAEGMLTCLELTAGRKVWQRALNAELKAPQGFFGVGVAPVVEKDLILLNVGGPAGAGIVGIDKATGRTAWQATDHGASYSTPVVRTILGRRMAIFLTQAGLVVLAPESGKVLHELPFRSPLRESVNAASPVVVDDVIFLSAAYGVGAAAVQVTADGLKVLWRDKRNMQNHWATSICRDGLLYGIHGRHEQEAVMRCIDLRTGQVRWTSQPGMGRSTFILTGAHFIALGERGDLYVVDASPDRYIQSKPVRLLEYPCWSPPVLANGLLYLRDEEHLLCLDLRQPKK
jgi:outer membrane protein assembly factor BamB